MLAASADDVSQAQLWAPTGDVRLQEEGSHQERAGPDLAREAWRNVFFPSKTPVW